MVQLPLPILRLSEDFHVDHLISDGPEMGVPILAATFPRIFVDPNRESDELDPEMFVDGARPAGVASPRVIAGLGVIPRLSGNEKEIYGRRLPFAEAQHRLKNFYQPYHQALKRLIRDTTDRFGCCVLLDCHSMPSVGLADGAVGRHRIDVDYVLGDCFGASCADRLTAAAETFFVLRGARVRRNNPYSGGYVAQCYGRPAQGVHVLQLEISRALYMDEAKLERSGGFGATRATLSALIAELAEASSKL